MIYRILSLYHILLLSLSSSLAVEAELKLGYLRGIKFGQYTPAVDRARPLLLLLHGCDQSSEDFLASTELLTMAQAQAWHLVTAEQNIFYHYQRCWNWFLPVNQSRMAGFELGTLVDYLKQYMASHKVQADQVYVIGLSAGAAMANNMAVCYPELIVGALLHSGPPFDPAQWPWQVSNTLSHGPTRSLNSLVERAWNCAGTGAKRTQKIMLVQGKADEVVDVVNAQWSAKQWLGLWDMQDDGKLNQSLTPTTQLRRETRGLFPYQTQTWRWGSQQLQLIQVDGLGHRWSGGKAGASYSEPAAPKASEWLRVFFGL